MVTSIDDVRPDPVPEPPVPPTQPLPMRAGSAHEAAPDLYAEAELRLRHERTSRLIEKAARDQV